MQSSLRNLFSLLILPVWGWVSAALCLVASSASGIELNRVILSSNNAPSYVEFWPVVAPIWTAMGFRPTLALVADESCTIDTTLGDVIRFDKIPGVSEALQAQVIRLFLPFLFPEDGCLISDIDMIPVSESYFRKGAELCPDEAFLVYRDKVFDSEGERFSMCYLAAKGKVFASVCKINSADEITERIREWADYGLGWNTDELLFFEKVTDWELNGGNLVRLGHDVGPRLDRGNWSFDIETLDISRYIDCHCPRPYSRYKGSIDRIVEKIYAHLESEK